MSKRAIPGRPAPVPAPVATPTREDIVAFISREREGSPERASTIGKREIARAFGIKGSDKVELKRVLRQLKAEGAIWRRGRSLSEPGRLPATVLAEIFSRDRDGDLLAKPVDWDAAEGPAPTIALHLPRRGKQNGPVPGLGDRALVRTERDHDAEAGGPAYVGRIVKVLARAGGRARYLQGRSGTWRPSVPRRQEGGEQGRLHGSGRR